MVHTGFSRGCDRCRQKHLACDRTTPECANCISQGLSCSGYRDTGGFLFKDESARVVRNGKQRHTPRSTASAALANRNQTMTTSGSDPAYQSPEDSAIHGLLSCAISHGRAPEDSGFFLFLETYTLFKRGPTPSRAHLNALVSFYQTADPSSPIAPVLSQVTGQLLSLYRGIKHTSPGQLQCRIRASKAIREALCDPLQCQKNEILLALILLDLGECIEYARSLDASCVGHHHAAMALISKRAPESFQDDLSQILLDAARHSAIRKGLWGIEQHLDLEVFTRAQNHKSGTHLTALNCIISQTLNLRRQIKAYFRGKYKWCTESLDKFCSACQSKETQIMEWIASVPENWRPVLQENPGFETLSWHCDRVEVYASYEAAFIYNQARCIRLLLLGIMHSLSLRRAVFDTAVSMHTAQTNMRTKAHVLCDAVLSSAPYLFNSCRDTRLQDSDRDRKLSSQEDDVVMDEKQLLLGFPVGARLGHWNLFEILQWMLCILADEEFGISVDEKVILTARDFIEELWF